MYPPSRIVAYLPHNIPQSTNPSVQRLSFDGPEHDILFTEATFPNASGVIAGTNNIDLNVSLDSGRHS